MKITVKFFALGRDLVGKSELQMEVTDNTTVENALAGLREKYPALAQLSTFRVAVNQEFCGMTTPLSEGDEMAIIPPVSGG